MWAAFINTFFRAGCSGEGFEGHSIAITRRLEMYVGDT